LPGPSISYKEWMDKTSSVGRKRSPELKALDDAILVYEARGATTALLDTVRTRLADWKHTQGLNDAWKKSTRNKGGYVELLTTKLKLNGGDTDSAWGLVPNFMHDELVHARLGVLYLFNHVKVDPKLFNVILEGGLAISSNIVTFHGLSTADGGLGIASASQLSAATPTVMVVGGPLIDGAWQAGHSTTVPANNRTKLETFAITIRNWFKEFVRGLVANLREKWNCELPASAVFGVTNTVCSAVLSATQAGIVSGAIDTAKGAVLTADAVLNRVRAWKSGQNVEFVSGHPTAMVESILRGMNMSIGEGLWKLLKGVGNIGVAFGTAGAGLILGIVVAAAELIAKIIYRLYEVTHMKKFFDKASEHWANRHSAEALHKRPFAFGKFYRKYVLNTPALGVLTLNSGICGSKMSFLSMFRDSAEPISSDAFLAGAKHLDSLKIWGATYLQNAGFSFKSSDDLVGQLLQFSAGSIKNDNVDGEPISRSFHAKDLSSTKAKVWNYVTRVASA